MSAGLWHDLPVVRRWLKGSAEKNFWMVLYIFYTGEGMATRMIVETAVAPATGVVHLKAEEKQIKWSDDVVDNEGMGKKSSKSA